MTRRNKMKANATLIVRTLKVAKRFVWDGLGIIPSDRRSHVCFAIYGACERKLVNSHESLITRLFINKALEGCLTAEAWLSHVHNVRLSPAKMQRWRLMWIDKMIDDLTTKYRL